MHGYLSRVSDVCSSVLVFNCVSYLLRHRLDDNKLDCIEVGSEGLDLISLAVARDT
jgi:hypothetical protein